MTSGVDNHCYVGGASTTDNMCRYQGQPGMICGMSDNSHPMGRALVERGGYHKARYLGGNNVQVAWAPEEAKQLACSACQAWPGQPCQTSVTSVSIPGVCTLAHAEGVCPNPLCDHVGIDTLEVLRAQHARCRSTVPDRSGPGSHPYDYCNTCQSEWPCAWARANALFEGIMLHLNSLNPEGIVQQGMTPDNVRQLAGLLVGELAPSGGTRGKLGRT